LHFIVRKVLRCIQRVEPQHGVTRCVMRHKIIIPRSVCRAAHSGTQHVNALRSVEWQGQLMFSKRERGGRQQRPQSAVRRAQAHSEPHFDFKAEQQRSAADPQFAEVFRIQAAPPQQLIAYK